jgi:hypothetical protein
LGYINAPPFAPGFEIPWGDASQRAASRPKRGSLGSRPRFARLGSHFVSTEALNALANDEFEQFISLREAAILDAERRFLSKFVLSIDENAPRNQEEIDADD